MNQRQTLAPTAFLADVARTVETCLREIAAPLGHPADLDGMGTGKMLRSRLAAQLLAHDAVAIDLEALTALCAATELSHTASLCHDDVVDQGLIRRSQPTLWRQTSPSAAVLIGDLMLFRSVALVAQADGGTHMDLYLRRIGQVIEAEARQELQFRGSSVDEDTCVDLARYKTGPLFAFVAAVCGGRDPARRDALDQAGHLLGAAYQLADDLLDETGDERRAGKTLGTDRKRHKHTLPQSRTRGTERARRHVRRLCESARAHLEPYPASQRAFGEYLRRDLAPVLALCDPALSSLVG